MPDHDPAHRERRSRPSSYSSDSDDRHRRRNADERVRSMNRSWRRDGIRDRSRETDRDRMRDRSRSGKRERSREGTRNRDYGNQDRNRERDTDRTSHRNDPRRRDDSRPRHHKRTRSRSPPDPRNRSLKHSHNSPNPYSHPKHHRTQSYTSSPPRQPTKSIRSHAPLPSQNQAYTDKSSGPQPITTTLTAPSPPSKQAPNYAPSGKLYTEANSAPNTTTPLKYNEPPSARLPPPSLPYLLYIFKGPSLLSTLPLHTRSCWLFGRDRAIVDCPTEHPSCSKQHAVLQFRHVEKRGEFGEKEGGVRLYVIDLESANGTRVNGEKVPEGRFVEVRSGDVLGFGESEREYVVLLPPKEGEKG